MMRLKVNGCKEIKIVLRLDIAACLCIFKTNVQVSICSTRFMYIGIRAYNYKSDHALYILPFSHFRFLNIGIRLMLFFRTSGAKNCD